MELGASIVHRHWWDFTCLEQSLAEQAASMTLEDVVKLANDQCHIKVYDKLDDMFLSQALEYITCWQQATEEAPAGLCGPVGPTAQMPIVAKLVNELNIDLKNCHFWGMDEWCIDGESVSMEHPLSFKGANYRHWYDKIKPELRMPEENLHFPTSSNLEQFSNSFNKYRCIKMQGGLGHALHWAFNDPFPRTGAYKVAPPSVKEYQKLGARHVQLHPISQIQNATGLSGRDISQMPNTAVTVGPKETFLSEEVSIWYPGHNQNPFGLKLSILMIANDIKSSVAPISVLADHKKITFHLYGPSIVSCEGKINA